MNGIRSHLTLTFSTLAHCHLDLNVTNITPLIFECEEYGFKEEDKFLIDQGCEISSVLLGNDLEDSDENEDNDFFVETEESEDSSSDSDSDLGDRDQPSQRRS
ncbi:hypothetical protein E2C01_054108 [Portunus trituberculatus]|uniref:Uncharacterized protein n=1 Tax=Portunus trituberculatus TaxID=210409 RepID=A0A5B7GM76_PORTR|nr:hypothetical protein [Portunus trituberculatus]